MIELGRHQGDDLVAVGGGASRTAGQLAGLSSVIADLLADLPPGARIVLACQDRYYFAASLLAIWQRGLVAVLPSNGQAATVRALARAPFARALLHDRDEDMGHDVRLLESRAGTLEPRFPVALERHAPAVVAFTSGSTGEPSGHEKTLAQLVDESRALIDCFGLAHRRVLASVPPYHLYGLLFGVLVPLLGGGTMSRNSPLQAPEVLRELADVNAHVLVAVPPQLAALAAFLRDTGAAVPALTRLFSSGAPLSELTDDALRGLGLVVTQVLGSTETGGVAQRCQAGNTPWLPLPGVATRVVDGDVLCVASPWSSAQPGAEVRTADRVVMLAHGFRHLGRADQVVKVAGRRIDVGDIETRLRALPDVRDARVLAVDTPSLRGLELWAVVESDSARPEALKQALAGQLDPVTVPRRYRVVPSLPRSAAGKLERTALLALFDVWELRREPQPDGSVRMPLPANYGYFRGHFDGDGLLPGVVQLEQLALRRARECFPELRHVARLTRVKFKRPIRPGEELSLQVQRRSELSVAFELHANGDLAASGILHFRGA